MSATAGIKGRAFSPVAAAAVIAGLFFCYALVTLDDFGITWDEPLHFEMGDLYLDRILSPDRPLTFSDSDFRGSMQYYGPVFDILGAVDARILTRAIHLLPEDNARHIHLIFLSAVTVFFTYLLVGEGTRQRTAFYSVLFLIAFPRYVGHSFNNPKDIPITCIFVISIFLFHRRLITGKKLYSVLLCLTGGIGFATRIQYILIPIVIISSYIIYICIRNKNMSGRFHALFAIWDVYITILITIPLGMLIWPYFWTSPGEKLKNLIDFYFYHRTQAHLLIRYLGNDYVPGVNLPWHYAPVMLAITTPLLTLGSAAAGLLAIILFFIRKHRSGKRTLFYIIIISWVLIGMIPFMLPGQRVYGGIRHFLFITPALCMIAGIGLNGITVLLEKKTGKRVYILIGVLFLFLFINTYSFHPYFTDYYNALVGGPRGAFTRFNLENWGNAYKKACRWMNSHAPEGAVVLVLTAPHIPRYYLRPDLKVINPREALTRFAAYDYSMYIIRDIDLLLDKTKLPVFSISVAGQPICNVHQWRGMTFTANTPSDKSGKNK